MHYMGLERMVHWHMYMVLLMHFVHVHLEINLKTHIIIFYIHSIQPMYTQ